MRLPGTANARNRRKADADVLLKANEPPAHKSRCEVGNVPGSTTVQRFGLQMASSR